MAGTTKTQCAGSVKELYLALKLRDLSEQFVVLVTEVAFLWAEHLGWMNPVTQASGTAWEKCSPFIRILEESGLTDCSSNPHPGTWV